MNVEHNDSYKLTESGRGAWDALVMDQHNKKEMKQSTVKSKSNLRVLCGPNTCTNCMVKALVRFHAYIILLRMQ